MNTQTNCWNPTCGPEVALPLEGKRVLVISPSGQEVLMFRKGKLWFFDDGSMYVYWTPAFWRELE